MRLVDPVVEDLSEVEHSDEDQKQQGEDERELDQGDPGFLRK